jgi:hypothetical protein
MTASPTACNFAAVKQQKPGFAHSKGGLCLLFKVQAGRVFSPARSRDNQRTSLAFQSLIRHNGMQLHDPILMSVQHHYRLKRRVSRNHHNRAILREKLVFIKDVPDIFWKPNLLVRIAVSSLTAKLPTGWTRT